MPSRVRGPAAICPVLLVDVFRPPFSLVEVCLFLSQAPARWSQHSPALASVDTPMGRSRRWPGTMSPPSSFVVCAVTTLRFCSDVEDCRGLEVAGLFPGLSLWSSKAVMDRTSLGKPSGSARGVVARSWGHDAMCRCWASGLTGPCVAFSGPTGIVLPRRGPTGGARVCGKGAGGSLPLRSGGALTSCRLL